MQGRSWMAALALAAGVCLVSIAGDPQARAGGETGVVNKVNLIIRINGFERPGGEFEVEVKPGHAGCEFKSISEKARSSAHVESRGLGEIEIRNLEVNSTRVDRDCLFAITIKEPGLPPKTYNRALRLDRPTPAKAVPRHNVLFFLQSPSLAARDDVNKRVK